MPIPCCLFAQSQPGESTSVVALDKSHDWLTVGDQMVPTDYHTRFQLMALNQIRDSMCISVTVSASKYCISDLIERGHAVALQTPQQTQGDEHLVRVHGYLPIRVRLPSWPMSWGSQSSWCPPCDVRTFCQSFINLSMGTNILTPRPLLRCAVLVEWATGTYWVRDVRLTTNRTGHGELEWERESLLLPLPVAARCCRNMRQLIQRGISFLFVFLFSNLLLQVRLFFDNRAIMARFEYDNNDNTI